jgi:hypothetical protein
LIENDFGRRPRISAPQDDCKRMLVPDRADDLAPERIIEHPRADAT